LLREGLNENIYKPNRFPFCCTLRYSSKFKHEGFSYTLLKRYILYFQRLIDNSPIELDKPEKSPLEDELPGQRENAGQGRAGTEDKDDDEDFDNDIQDRLERMNTRQKPGTPLRDITLQHRVLFWIIDVVGEKPKVCLCLK
jgi:hypothetical protein